MGRRSFKPGTLLSPVAAVMATVGDMENSNIITIGWCGILSSDPPRTYISVRPTRHSHKMLLERGEFVINLTTERLAYATDFSGIYTGAKVDKFEKLGLKKIPSEKVAPPTIEGAPVALECRVFEVLHFGTHDVFMADIVNVSCDNDILEGDKICLDKAGLMAYAHGEYFALGKKIGRFGFSTSKEAKAKERRRKSTSDTPQQKGTADKKTSPEVKARAPKRGSGAPRAKKGGKAK